MRPLRPFACKVACFGCVCDSIAPRGKRGTKGEAMRGNPSPRTRETKADEGGQTRARFSALSRCKIYACKVWRAVNASTRTHNTP